MTGAGGPGHPAPRVRVVALLGFMGAGKSTVGARLARALGWRFIDVDRELERRTGRSIAAHFEDPGEPAFRAIESDLTAALFDEDHAVLALGGGWAAQPGAFERVPAGVRTIWLRVSVAEALRRAASDPVVRPLLAGPDPAATAQVLLCEREAGYARADLQVETDGLEPDGVVRAVLHLLRNDGIEWQRPVTGS